MKIRRNENFSFDLYLKNVVSTFLRQVNGIYIKKLGEICLLLSVET